MVEENLTVQPYARYKESISLIHFTDDSHHDKIKQPVNKVDQNHVLSACNAAFCYTEHHDTFAVSAYKVSLFKKLIYSPLNNDKYFY